MCGICGKIYHDHTRQVEPDLLRRMTSVITHRGPDDEGYFLYGNAGLGSRRLSIVGLEDGHMPMSSPDGSIVLVYNGELYNHPQLKHVLERKGYAYQTCSDTETFLHLYREYGEGFLDHARGMFALALWDKNQQKLILARDRLGIKPVYYHLDDQAIRFGSEIKCMLCDPQVSREIDLEALNFFLAYLSAPAPYSMFQNIRKLKPGEMLIYQNGRMDRRMYWTPQPEFRQIPENDPQAQPQELLKRLRQVVHEHLMADVPVGAFLSGGIDSSLLVALMHEELGGNFKTFSIGFEGYSLFDESKQAGETARRLGTDHTEKILNPEDLLKALDHITWQLDEPLADSSCFPVYYVSQLAAQQVKVVLSGDGGDELFAGYRKYQAEYYRHYFNWMPNALQEALIRSAVSCLPESRKNFGMDLLRQVKKFFRGLHPDAFERHLGLAIHYEDPLRSSILSRGVLEQIDFLEVREFRRRLFDEVEQLDDLTRMLWVDLRHNLPADMLMKVDRMSMLHSLEVRVPFLDHQLVEYAFRLPGSVKLRGKTGKWILKEAAKGLLPDEILHRRKHGFDIPIGEWFKRELRDVIEDICSPETAKRRGLFHPRRLQQILTDHQNGKRDYNNHLWILLSLELWQRQFLDAPAGSVPHPPSV
ncbi:MAG: asparagine synthase (glutamine-hydrolyzing) [bacterium]